MFVSTRPMSNFNKSRVLTQSVRTFKCYAIKIRLLHFLQTLLFLLMKINFIHTPFQATATVKSHVIFSGTTWGVGATSASTVKRSEPSVEKHLYGMRLPPLHCIWRFSDHAQCLAQLWSHQTLPHDFGRWDVIWHLNSGLLFATL